MTVAGGRRWVGEAPAKVNLLLRILDRESLGYHRIETIFQALELADGVEIDVREGVGSGAPPSISLEVRGVIPGELGPPEANLAYRAASRFREELLRHGVAPPFLSIRLEKRIPHGAGLGGGSSDAAAVLRGVNILAGEPLSHADLMRIGGELGSDVPFFLCGSSLALGEGRGERLTRYSALPQRDVLLLVPAEGIATGWAYGVLAEVRQRAGGRTTSEPSPGGAGSQGASTTSTSSVRPSGPGEPSAAGAQWKDIAAVAANDFEAVLFPLRPELATMKDLLLRHGASPALLSGSGSVVFGIFSDHAALQDAEDEASSVGLRSIRTRTAVTAANASIERRRP